MADAAQDLPDLGLPAGSLEPQDVADVRFSMAPRGYRMSEVDVVLERLAAELADRDRRLAELLQPDLRDEDGAPPAR
jgi:DivIVA domain-containing protein